jgi:hypothetical protein
MFAKKVILMALCGLVGSASGGGDIKDQASLKLELIETLNVKVAQLTAFASQCNRGMCEANGEVNRRLVDDRVQKILAGVQDCDLLFRLAVFSYGVAFPQEGATQRIDVVYDSAWNEALRKLGKLRSPNSLAALKSIDSLLKTDGGEALALRSMIEAGEQSIPAR